jgi:hypothetical protein
MCWWKALFAAASSSPRLSVLVVTLHSYKSRYPGLEFRRYATPHIGISCTNSSDKLRSLGRHSLLAHLGHGLWLLVATARVSGNPQELFSSRFVCLRIHSQFLCCKMTLYQVQMCSGKGNAIRKWAPKFGCAGNKTICANLQASLFCKSTDRRVLGSCLLRHIVSLLDSGHETSNYAESCCLAMARWQWPQETWTRQLHCNKEKIFFFFCLGSLCLVIASREEQRLLSVCQWSGESCFVGELILLQCSR